MPQAQPAVEEEPAGPKDVRAGLLEAPVQATGAGEGRPRSARICPKCGKLHPSTVSYCTEDGTKLSGIVDSVPETGDHGISMVGSVHGSYRLLKLLGEGGMGHVYLAEHTRLARKVALKMLRPEHASNPGAIKRFFMEARAVNQIKNENIVEITDFIEDEGGHNYYIMELLDGHSLGDLLTCGGAMPVRRALGIAIQVASALATVHEGGIIHRDLKPENIFLLERGGSQDFVKVLDFGVAKLAMPELAKDIHKTAAGAILGTPEYMSPEQVSGNEVDYRTDIYSLGIILFEMVTGKKPFSAKTIGEIVIKHLTVKPPRPSRLKDSTVKLPQAFEDLIMQCLEKDPKNRPKNMREIESRLRQMHRADSAELQDLEIVERPAGAKDKLMLGIGLVALAAGGALIFVLYWGKGESATATPPPPPPPTVEEELPLEPLAPKTEVEILFDSVPPGAEIYRTGADQALGRTPAKLSFARTMKPEAFQFRLVGFETLRQEVPLDKDFQLVVTLVKEAKPDAGRLPAVSHKPRPNTDSGGTIDPFLE